ncbi:unnamed protein product [Caenorhabditis brenneri]
MKPEQKVEPNLGAMPQLILEKIVVGLDFVSLQCLRKASDSLHNHVDDTAPEANLYDVYVSADADSITTIYRGRDENSIFSTKVSYKIEQTGCLVASGERSKLLNGENYAEVAVKDLILILKHHFGVINHFHVEFPFSDPTCVAQVPIFNQFLLTLHDYLESRTAHLKVKRFHMTLANIDQLMNVYPFLEAGVLERTSICKFSGREMQREVERNPGRGNYEDETNLNEEGETLNVDRLVQLEQWKSCKDIVIDDFVVTAPLANLVNLSQGTVASEAVSLADLEVIRDAALFSDCPRHLYIRFKRLVDVNDISTKYGKWYQEESDHRLVEFRNGNRILKVTFRPYKHFFFSKFPF